MDTKQRL